MSESSAPAGRDPSAPGGGWHPLRRTWQVIARTATKAWDDSIFGKAATAAFWQTLSLPPLLLGLLGMLGYVGGWFGPDTVTIIRQKIITFSGTVFSDSVVEQLIEPTVGDVLARGRLEIVSLGFLLSLWAGSSAISTFVDSIVEAHGQQDARHPVWQRFFALLLYVIFLILAVFTLPLVALGPTLLGRVLPESWRSVGSEIVDTFYYPAVGLLLIVGLTTLYKVALHKSLPWHRLLGGALVAGGFFLAASSGLRWYLSWVTGTGYTYGALAAPIAFLLFTFFLGFAVVLGAEFNATIQEFWPARATRIEQMREWLAAQAAAEGVESVRPVTTLTWRLATGPIRQVTDTAGGRSESAEPPPGQDGAPERPDEPGADGDAGRVQSPLRRPS
ncbi:YihY/virulence factor BrkB family protein [Rhodococcus triatomae]|uniref:Membrane protein n=1 Tax=Rhodococcus triatomae TaxID=300028 RepID=A0A1G8MR99_9NOCA|nr:YihY/virulence factor BrkB family protein [Rhodococcus triatomae]QNG19063.1 YihY/virulence factor BrkB family protein [Rhodococcus triatomae]QNG25024.1 YihY/virulence factor BrkB family protein [Rhodococcus triatomae]SDI70373.1 membrane protein [Rhodococcus triatomae]